jgi:DNA-directed RNA polymerase
MIFYKKGEPYMDLSEKFERQCTLEMESFSLGIDRYLMHKHKIDSNTDKDNTLLKPEQKLMQGYLVEISKTVNKVIFRKGRGGSKITRECKEFLRVFDTDRLSFVTLRYCFNVTPEDNLVAVCRKLGNQIEKDYDYLMFQEKAPGYLSKVEKNIRSFHLKYRHKVLSHASKKVKIQDKDGKVIETGIPILNWTPEKQFHIGKILIEIVTQTKPCLFKTDYIHKRKNVSNVKHGFINVKQLRLIRTKECQEILEKAHEYLKELAPLSYPCIINPKPWEGTHGGGFHTQYKSLRTQLLRSHYPNPIQNAGEHGVDIVTQSLNIIQDTKFKINKRVLKVLKVAQTMGIGGLPAPDCDRVEVNGRYPLEEDTPWTNEEFQQLKELKDPELFRWIAEKAAAHDIWNRNMSKRQSLIWKLKIAHKFKNEPELYYVWNCDYRGRIYCKQPFINPQMDDSGKALLEFTEGKPLGKHGLQWFCIHGANEFGFDKASLDERVQWVEDNKAKIVESADNPIDGKRFWCDADDPFCFLAFCFEYADYKRDPKSFVSYLPVQTDGTCSGLQHYSALLRDSNGGQVVNLIPGIEKSDVYAEVAEIVNKKLQEEQKDGGDNGKYATAWLKVGVDRKICKRNVMTFCYGATRNGFSQQLIDHIMKEGINLGNSFEIVDEFKACNYLAGINWNAIKETLVKSVEGMKLLQKIGFFMAGQGLDIQWTNEVGLRVTQVYPKTISKRIKTWWGGVLIKPRFAKPDSSGEKDCVGNRNGIAPNYIHSLDASHLMKTAIACHDEGITAFSFIHDSFGTHAADMEVMSRILRETFVEMYSKDLLTKFVDDVRQQVPVDALEEFEEIIQEYMPTMGDLDVSCVRDSSYFFS